MSQHHANEPADAPGPRRPRPQSQPSRRELPRCRLILHSSPVNDMMFIVRTIMEVTRFCLAEATHKMWEAHHCGRSVLFTTYRERAELFVEQFASRGLKVTIEAA